MRAFTGLLAGAVLIAAPALADETWKSDLGVVQWEKDYDGGAIFSVAIAKGKVARFYIEGLKPEGARSSYDGYWISEVDENLCSASLTGPDGTKSKTWGRLELTFLKKGFPSDWVMKTADCMGIPNEAMSGFAPE